MAMLKKAKKIGYYVKKKVTIKHVKISNKPEYGAAESICWNGRSSGREVFLLILSVVLMVGLYVDKIDYSPSSSLAHRFAAGSSWSTGGYSRALLRKLGMMKGAATSASERAGVLDWIQLESFPMKVNETERMLEHMAVFEDGHPCYAVPTHHAQVFGLPSPEGEKLDVQLVAGPAHFLTIISYDKDGNGRCAGGDYFEIDLSSQHWKSRPPVTDLGNGSYLVMIQVDPQFIGFFLFKIYLAFSNFQGLYWIPLYRRHPHYKGIEIIKMQIEFTGPGSSSSPSPPHPHNGHALPKLEKCDGAKGDFNLQQWAGRWTRTKFNEPCLIDPDGRYICLDLDAHCEDAWCDGQLGSLESNGWVYSAHCKFRIFTREEAWNCLNGKYILSWGDSNHQDTLRNLIRYVLGCNNSLKRMPRRFDHVYHRGDCRGYHSNLTDEQDEFQELLPQTQAQWVRIANIFNGHYLETMNNLGLWSLSYNDFREAIELKAMGDKEHAPDILILNSGIHDTVYWKKPSDFVNFGVGMAMKMWQKIFDGLQPRKPLVIYRHSVAAAGADRWTVMNPSKLELYTRILGQSFAQLKLTNFRIVDDFDMTFPWHYDYAHSDGLHYGRLPENMKWVDGSIGHQYFVDLMLVHVHLNIICPMP